MAELNVQAGRKRATTFDAEQLRGFIAAIFGPNPDSDQSAGGRFVALHEKMRLRELHYHNDPAVDPVIPPPYDRGNKFQTDFLRQTNRRLLAKQIENKPIVKVVPGSSLSTVKDKADDFEIVMNTILDEVQDRERIDIQATLHRDANILAYGVLHWVMHNGVYPKMPEYMYSAEPAEGYRDYKDDNDTGYRETDETYRDRVNKGRAGAGVPWYVECIHPMQFGFIEDRSMSNGMAMCLVRRKIPLLDYQRKLREDDKIVLSLNDVDKKINIYEEKDAPPEGTSSYVNDLLAWGKTVYVIEIWTRDEFYEMASGVENGNGWEIVKSFKHPYSMPPFALAPGDENSSPRLEYKFEPLLTGIYRIKPYYDRARTLVDIIAEMIALPLFYIKLPDGKMFTEGGKPVFLSRNSLMAQTLPNGGTIEKVEYNINPAVNEWIGALKQEMEDAAPSSGSAEISASTEPWAIRLQQAEANIEIKPSVQAVATAYRSMVRNMAYVMSLPVEEGGFGEPVMVFGRTQDGAIDMTKAIGVDPADIMDFKLEVNIDPHSSAERITMEQHGLDMLGNPNSLLTRREYAENYAGKPDGRRAVLEKDAEQIWLERIKPAVLEQELARSYDNFIVLAANGLFVGMDGQEILPEEVLSRNGQPAVPTQTPQSPEMSQLAMPSLPSLSTPGAQSIQGMPG